MLRLYPPRGKSPYWTARGTYKGRRFDKSTKAKSREAAELVVQEWQAKLDAGDGLEWRQIPGFSRYEISDNGLVRRLPAILKPTPRPSGHMSVTIYSDDGKAWRTGVHHLVARAFLGAPPDGKPYACHKNGIADENTKHNLYWGSAAENAADAVRHASLIRGPIVKSVDNSGRRRRRKVKITMYQALDEAAR